LIIKELAKKNELIIMNAIKLLSIIKNKSLTTKY